MFWDAFKNNKQKRREQLVNNAVEDINSTYGSYAFTGSLSEDMKLIKELFRDVDVLRVRELANRRNGKQKFCVVYCDGLVDSLLIGQTIIEPLVNADITPQCGDSLSELLLKEVLFASEAKKTSELYAVIDAVTYGDAVLLADGCKEVIVLNAKGFETRSVTEPESEKTLSGPREGFTESIMKNLSLVYRRLRTPALKTRFLKIGRRSNTSVCVCYLEGIVNKQVLAELYRRLNKIDIDAILDTNYLTELMRDAPWSPFRTTGYTEKPDVIVGKILEGRIAVFVDGTCNVLTIPYLFVENFQSSEDYYLSFYYTSAARILRILGFFFTIITPGLYVAIVAFHREMMPQSLLINIATERQSVPLPAALEAFVMLIVFDILRETGVRMPSSIGQALSIVGALVIGQAAVEAKLVASPMIIIIGFTGITNLLVPKMNAPVIYLRIALLTMASMFGFFGLVIGMLMLMMHIFNLKSFGVSQFIHVGNLHLQDIKDSVIRAPWWDMITRPKMLTKNRVRMAGKDGENHG